MRRSVRQRSVLSSILAWVLLLGICHDETFAQTAPGKTPRAGLGPSGGQYKALLIGIDGYKNGWAPLKSPEHGVRALEPILQQEYGFSVQKLLGEDATRHALSKQIEDFLVKAKENDSLLLYFSGHGAVDAGGVSYWIPVDAAPGTYDGINKALVQSWLHRSPARHILLVVDACYGAGIADPKGPEAPPPSRSTSEYVAWMNARSREALTAGGKELVDDRMKNSEHHRALEGHTPFTYHLVRTLDRQSGAYFAAEQLHSEILRGVEAYVDYKPRLLPLDNLDGGFVFVRKGGGVAPGDGHSGYSKGSGSEGDERTPVVSVARLRVASNIGGDVWLDDKKVGAVKSGTSFPISSGPGSFRLKLVGACEQVEEVVNITPYQLGQEVPVTLNGTPGQHCTRLPAAQGRQPEVIQWRSLPGTGPDGFWMGSKDGVGEDDERPRHKVVVQPFQLSKTEVTVAQYQACVDAGKCTPPNWDSCYTLIDSKWKLGKVSDLFKGAQQPVVCVDWSQAKAYAAWLSMVVGGTVRLPTEAEWEYAARGKEERQYPWGDSPEPSCDVAVLDPPGAVGDGCGQGSTWPVCSKEKGNTPSGLCDLGGNVWEWVEDCYEGNYKDARVDGSARTVCSGSVRVLRGGSWYFDATLLRGAYRFGGWPSFRLIDVGFRVVWPVSPGAASGL